MRGRGVWKMKAAHIVRCRLALITCDATVRAVGAVTGLTIHGDRLAITGQLVANHPLLGLPDPLNNYSSNPVTYGMVTLP